MTTTRTLDWRTDWAQFINDVARDLERGFTAEELSDKYSHQAVEWVGNVSDIRYGDYPAIKLAMPPIQVRMTDGRFGVIDYLSLVVACHSTELWKHVKIGQGIRFRTSIRKGSELFPGLSWADLGEKKGYVSIATTPSELLEILADDPNNCYQPVDQKTRQTEH